MMVEALDADDIATCVWFPPDPYYLACAPGATEEQMADLRAQTDKARQDPDYTITTNYHVTFSVVGGQPLVCQRDRFPKACLRILEPQE